MVSVVPDVPALQHPDELLQPDVPAFFWHDEQPIATYHPLSSWDVHHDNCLGQPSGKFDYSVFYSAPAWADKDIDIQPIGWGDDFKDEYNSPPDENDDDSMEYIHYLYSQPAIYQHTLHCCDQPWP